jgi:uncharacterized protein
MLKLSEIYVYPVKSLGGVSLEETEITDRGLQYDRRWMLVDENNRFLSQREYPQLAIFEITLFTDYLRIMDSRSSKGVIVKLEPQFSEITGVIKTTVWDDKVEAWHISKLVDDFFTEALGIPTRLVYMPEESHRKTDAQYALSGDEITSFSDGYPILIIGQSSMDDLNNRMAEPLSILRFRPNFVFTGGNEFEEDEWHEFNIGNVRFFGVKPCARCVMTTVNPLTGEKKGKEPLLTLNKYRKAGNKILFGQNVLISQLGSVSVGDNIEVVSRKKLAKFEVGG